MAGRTYIVGGVSLPPLSGEATVFHAARKKLSRVGLFDPSAEYRIHKRSIDARKKNDVRFVYAVSVTGDFPALSEENARLSGIKEQLSEEPAPSFGKEPLSARPVVVGAGPAGLFAALLLAENGFMPILLERGGDVDTRVSAYQRFIEERVLSTESNIQFGAGGAGTFSDGKLLSRVSDPFSMYVLRRMVEFGAPKEILYLAKPHIGTDYLRTVTKNLIKAIERAGGEVHFQTRMTGILRKDRRITGVLTDRGEIAAGAVILAIGNAARDSFRTLIADGYLVEAKPFSVGVRIEHLQKDIDRALYGDFAEGHGLPPAEYALSADTKTRGVYTFCMCPGGEVVAAASEEGGVVVNGMSHHARDGRNANSAVAVSVFTSDFGNDPLRGMAFQREIESRAFSAGGSDYRAPVSTVGDFLSKTSGTLPTRILPTYMGGNAYRLASPDSYLPSFIAEALRGGLLAFDKRIRGFASPDAILTGAETRTSSPIRILRNEMRTAVGTENLYPAGEGAGYAGGITSAALDGLRSALALMAAYRPIR